MAAPTLSCAKVDSSGKVTILGPKVSPPDVVTTDDVKDATKLAGLIKRVLDVVSMLAARWYPSRIDFEDVPTGVIGTTTAFAHGLDGRVRWSVEGWRTNATATTDNLLCHGTMWLMRGLWGPFAATATAGNFTVGMRFQATSPCLVTGIRFLWKAATRTVKATLWRNSDGAILGSGTVACVNSGIYSVTFATPVILADADLNVNLSVTIYDGAGTIYCATADDLQFRAMLPLTLPGFTLSEPAIFAAGDAFPASVAATTQCYVEPILAPVSPQLVESSATTSDTLSLTSYSPGSAVVRVEAAG